jgi:hypothetical protein
MLLCVFVYCVIHYVLYVVYVCAPARLDHARYCPTVAGNVLEMLSCRWASDSTLLYTTHCLQSCMLMSAAIALRCDDVN